MSLESTDKEITLKFPSLRRPSIPCKDKHKYPEVEDCTASDFLGGPQPRETHSAAGTTTPIEDKTPASSETESGGRKSSRKNRTKRGYPKNDSEDDMSDVDISSDHIENVHHENTEDEPVDLANAAFAIENDNTFQFDDQDSLEIDPEDEDLNWSRQPFDWDGFFRLSDPREIYAFEHNHPNAAPAIRAAMRVVDRLGRPGSLIPEHMNPVEMLRRTGLPAPLRRLVARDGEPVSTELIVQVARDWAARVLQVAQEMSAGLPGLEQQDRVIGRGRR